jgi:hypothetical protein
MLTNDKSNIYNDYDISIDNIEELSIKYDTNKKIIEYNIFNKLDKNVLINIYLNRISNYIMKKEDENNEILEYIDAIKYLLIN